MEHELDQEINSLNSIVHIQASEIYPKKAAIVEDAGLPLNPFPQLYGEYIAYQGRITEGVIVLTNFRLFMHTKKNIFNIPLGLIEQVEIRDIFILHVYCKDARSVHCTFSTNDHSTEWHKRLIAATSPPKKIDDIFAFAFRAWCSEESTLDLHSAMMLEDSTLFNVKNEASRMMFNLKSVWRISLINYDYKFCSTYPRELLVPAAIEDEELEQVANFRSSRRIPIVVWRHQGNGSVIARCSQPEVGWLGWRNSVDESLVLAIAKACALDPGSQKESFSTTTIVDKDIVANGTAGIREHKDVAATPKVLILDARSYAAAVANRAKGGGCECPEYYPNCEIQFMSLANIHYIRKSFQSVRTLCAAGADQINWFSMLENTKWLQHISGLIKAALTVVNIVDREGRPVLVHCSDGWDRTPQIVALAEILLDPYYRTLEGFQVLVEREWLEFGHKFGDRCGHGLQANDTNERCPVFLQWLDCVHQLLCQFPCSFEFNEMYLVKLVNHTYSCLYGTFLCNSSQERVMDRVSERTYSVWALLKVHQKRFRNFLYTNKEQVLRPSYHVRDLRFWSTVYTPDFITTEEILHLSMTTESSPTIVESMKSERDGSGSLIKTRSCENLLSAVDYFQGRQRRSSDPSLMDGKRPFSHDVELREIGKETLVIRDDGDVKFYNCSPASSRTLVVNDHPEVLENGSESVATNSDSDNEQDASEVHSNTDVCQPNDAAAFESSTDTLVGELGSHCSEPQLDPLCSGTKGNCSPNKNSNRIDCSNFRTKNLEHPKQRLKNQLSNVSTSTSDISDSHVVKEQVKQTSIGLNGHSHSWTHALPCARCPFCINGKKLVQNNFDVFKTSGSGMSSINSTPLHSRTPSSGFPATPNDDRLSDCAVSRCSSVLAQKLDIDGLTILRDRVQNRLQEIASAHLHEVQRLKQELCATRLALYQQLCHKCNGSTQINQENTDEVLSLPDSIGSGEHQSLGQESNSDVSWEQVDEDDTRPTLWVPDHAVTRCTGCETEFWLGRRKHHCRNCGNIFCADCSSQMVPIPSEQLYHPVRVCSFCYEYLRNPRCRQACMDSKLSKQVTTATAAASN